MITDSFRNALAEAIGPDRLISDQDILSPWLRDWRGRYQGSAALMAQPETMAQVATIVGLCAEHRVPVVPQGGNTSMVGGATPPCDGSALLLSLRAMRRIRTIDAAGGLAVAEAGVILSDLHDAASSKHLRFPLSLGAKGSATIGGLCSTNAGGTQVLRFGTMRSLVLGLEAVLPDGSVFDSLAPLKKDNRGPDLKQLLIGGEGCFGIVTAAALQLVPMPREVVTAWAGLASPHAALSLLRRLEQAGQAVESFELVPADALGNVLRYIPGTRAPLERSSPWNALIEMTGDGGVEAALQDGLASAARDGLLEDAVIASSLEQAQAFWRLRESISEAERASGPALQHDISVPVAAMPDFMIATAREVEQAFPGTSANAFGHLGDGNVHFHIRAPTAEGVRWIAEHGSDASGFVYDRVMRAGGSISAEHGIGQMKVCELARLSDPARLAMLRNLKAAFDPLGIMNPGKLIPSLDLASEGRAT